MAHKLTFALVSPERELFNGDVDHVVVPVTLESLVAKLETLIPELMELNCGIMAY